MSEPDEARPKNTLLISGLPLMVPVPNKKPKPKEFSYHRATFYDCCELTVEISSTGPDGGDCSKTSIRFSDAAALNLTIYGDAEVRVLREALKYLSRCIDAMGF